MFKFFQKSILLLSVLILAFTPCIPVFAAADEPYLTAGSSELPYSSAAESDTAPYVGISFPEGAIKLEDAKCAMGPSKDTFIWTDSGDGNGSRVLADSKKDLSDFDEATDAEMIFSYTKTHTLKTGEANTRYIVSSVNLTAGEALDGNFMEFYAAGSQVGASGERENFTVRIPLFDYDRKSGMILLSSEALGSDNGGASELAHFSTELYTNFTVIFDGLENLAYYYINGIEAGRRDGFLPGGKTSLLYEYNLSARIKEFCPSAGVFFKCGEIKAYRTDDTDDVFDSDGNFIYGNNSPENGIFKIGGSYFFFENGFINNNEEIVFGEYLLEADKRSGKILNCCRKSSKKVFTPKTDAELSALEANGTLSGLETGLLGSEYKDLSYTSTGGAEKITAYKKVNSVVTPYEIDAIKSYSYKEGEAFTVGFKKYTADSYSPSSYYKSEDMSTANKVAYKEASKKIEYIYADPKTKLRESFVLSFDIKFGEGVNNLIDNTADGTDFSMTFFNFYVYLSSEKKAVPFGMIKMIEGVPHIYLGGVDCGICDTENFTNISIFSEIENYTLYTYVYINGELKQDKRSLTSDLNYVDYFTVTSSSKFSWEGELMTLLPATVYKSESYLDSVTDGYTGFADSGSDLIWYNNGSIVNRGSFDTVEGVALKKYAELEGYNIALSQNIHLNFLMRFGTLAKEDGAYAKLKVGSTEERIYLNTLTPDKNGLYRIKAELPARLIYEDVFIEIYSEDGTRVEILKKNLYSETWSYSIKRYAEYIFRSSENYSSEMIEAVKSMLLYGAYAKRYFLSDMTLSGAEALSDFERLAVKYGNAGLFLSELKYEGGNISYKVNDKRSELDFTASSTDASALGKVYLKLGSSLTLRIELTSKEAPTALEGASLCSEISADGGIKYYLEIGGILPKDFGTLISAKLDGTVIKISPLAAANIAINDKDAAYSESFADLLKAMCLYHFRVNDYISKGGNV